MIRYSCKNINTHLNFKHVVLIKRKTKLRRNANYFLSPTSITEINEADIWEQATPKEHFAGIPGNCRYKCGPTNAMFKA